MSIAPASAIDQILPQKVVLTLKDGRQFAGRLTGIDEHLNLVLEETEESGGEVNRRLGRVVLRGSNIVSMQALGTPTPGRAA
ncbi:MAG TPA: LSM domain-containing protein [Thermoplasmata archaeon]|nr:LSM domain-containing protein [Thermoplasmata archaeon]